MCVLRVCCVCVACVLRVCVCVCVCEGTSEWGRDGGKLRKRAR